LSAEVQSFFGALARAKDTVPSPAIPSNSNPLAL